MSTDMCQSVSSAQLCPEQVENIMERLLCSSTIHPKHELPVAVYDRLLSMIWQNLYVIGIQGKQT